jgi:hypothetical protein
MKNGRSGLAALAAVVLLLAASPAFAVTATCTAKDSVGKHWSETKTDLIDWSAKTYAGALAKADCQDKSRHPATCKLVSCKVTK